MLTRGIRGILLSSLVSSIDIIQHRWYFSAQLLLSIPLAVSLIIIHHLSKRRIIGSIVVFSIVLIITFSSVLNPAANIDNRELTPVSVVRYGYMPSEISAAAFSSVVSESDIQTDFAYAGFIKYTYQAHVYGIDTQLIDNRLPAGSSLKLIREEIINNTTHIMPPLNSICSVKAALIEDGFSVVYDCGSVNAYVY